MRSSKEIIGGIEALYDELDVPRNIREHMHRVAAVARYICTHWKGAPFNNDLVIAACLLHDVGNVLKMRYDTEENLAMLGPERERVEYWKATSKVLQSQYANPNELRDALLTKATISADVCELISRARGARMGTIMLEKYAEAAIYLYADNRVGPFGYVTLTERMADTERRYPGYYDTPERKASNYKENLLRIEDWLCAETNAPLRTNTFFDSFRFDRNNNLITNAVSLWETLETLPNVREHQARVAGYVCVLREHWKPTAPHIDWDFVIAAALLHDIGNIAKADLTTKFSQHVLGPVECERLDYWLAVQERHVAEFGKSEWAITKGLLERIRAEHLWPVIEGSGFAQNVATAASSDWPCKILAHADHCVGPFCVVPMRERLAEGAKRRGLDPAAAAEEPVVRAVYEIAAAVQAQVSIPLDSITEELVAPYTNQFLSSATEHQ
jgi:HD superfamily phosphodiesterase